MKTIRATILAKQLGISRFTMACICRRDTKLAFKRNGIYYIRITELAKLPGFNLIDALLVPHGNWVKAIDLARLSGISRRTMTSWCKTRHNFAKRIARVWYVDLDQLDATESQIETLKQCVLGNKGNRIIT